MALHVSLGTFSSATIVSLVVEQWTPGDYSALLHRGLARSLDPLCSIRLLLFISSLFPPRFLPLNLHPTSPIYFSLSFFAPFAGSKPSKVVAWQSTEGYARVSSSPTPPALPPSLSQMTRWRFQVKVRLSAFPSIRLCCTSMHGRVVPHLIWDSSWPPFPQPCTPLAPSARFFPSLKPPSPLPLGKTTNVSLMVSTGCVHHLHHTVGNEKKSLTCLYDYFFFQIVTVVICISEVFSHCVTSKQSACHRFCELKSCNCLPMLDLDGEPWSAGFYC